MRIRAIVLPKLEDQKLAELGSWLAIDPVGVRVPTGPIAVLRDFDYQQKVGRATVRLFKERLVAMAEIDDAAYQEGDFLCASLVVREARHPGGVSACDLMALSLTQTPMIETQPIAEVLHEQAAQPA